MSYQGQEKVYAQQPQAQPGMMVTGGNRNAKNLPVDADGREWSHGLFDCCDDASTCLIATCFPCITYGQNKKRFEHLNAKGYPDPEHGGMFSGDCFLHACITTFCGVGFLLQMSTRGGIRSRYNIKGGGCGDCCIAMCCTPCELTQESRELDLEESTYGNQHHA